MIRFLLNDQLVRTHQPAALPALDFVREHQHLRGTKTGCREGDCGACTVLLGELSADGQTVVYRSMTSCLLPLANVEGKHLVTIEGLNLSARPHDLNRAQEAIVACGGTQCGFCTVGFAVSLTGHCLTSLGAPTYEQTVASIDGNICRCTGYKSLERAAAQLTAELAELPATNPLSWLTENGFVPAYFTSVAEKLAAIRPLPVVAPPATPTTFLSGGTDLLVQRPEAMLTTATANLFDQTGLRGIRRDGDTISIGAATTAQEMMDSDVMAAIFPRLRQHLKLVSSTPIRQMGTVGGNLCNASPIGDLTCWFLALDADLTLADGLGGERTLPLREFYTGYKQLAKSPTEYLATISFRALGANDFFNFEKVSKRTHLDIASVNSAARLRLRDGIIQEAVISAGGVSATPLFLRRTSAFLIGRELSMETMDAANELAQQEIAPIADARGTETYKRLLVRQLLRAHALEGSSQQQKAVSAEAR
jgi:xanthine dehydrogenase small subunit